MPTWVLDSFVKKCRSLGELVSSWFLLGVSVTRSPTHKPQLWLGDMCARAHLQTSRSSQLRLTKLQEVSRPRGTLALAKNSRTEDFKISHYNCCGALPSDSHPSDQDISSNSSCWQTLLILPDILEQLLPLCPIMPPSPVAWPVLRQRSCVVLSKNIERRSKLPLMHVAAVRSSIEM